MKKTKVMIIASLMLLFIAVTSACSFTSKTNNDDQAQKSNATAETTPDRDNTAGKASPSASSAEPSSESSGTTATETASATPSTQPSAGSTASPESQPPQSRSNDLLQKNMEKVDSYRRKIKFVSTPPPTAGGPIDTAFDEAYVKSPFAMYGLVESVAFESRNEDIVVNDTWYERKNENDKWMKHTPGDFGGEGIQPTFQYFLSPMFYPINYEKLTLTLDGNENVNEVDCVKYAVSGSYEEDITLYEGTEYQQVNTLSLSAAGTLWISKDQTLGQVIIRQRLTVNRDIVNKEFLDNEGNPTHSIAEEVIEDDITEINSTVIEAPSDADTIPYQPEEAAAPWESQTPETQNPEDNQPVTGIIPADQRQPGPVTEEQAAPWTKYFWDTYQGYMIFERINGYVVGYYANDSKEKLGIKNKVVGIVNGNVLSGEYEFMDDCGEFEFTMAESGEAFTGKWKYDFLTDWSDWNGTSIGLK